MMICVVVMPTRFVTLLSAAMLVISAGDTALSAQSGGSRPVGYFDRAVGNATQTSTVYQSDALIASGWAADYNDNGPAKSVQVLIDGAVAGNATLGGSRPDVASAYDNPAWKMSGWSYSMSASSLAVGSHTVTAVATDSLGLTRTLGPTSVSVLSATPVGHVDYGFGSATQTSTVYQSDALAIGGWAADYNDNGRAKSVQVLVDGSVVGNATLGISRPDVASVYNNSAWQPSGWGFTISAASLTVGSHTVSAVAMDSIGLTSNVGSAAITVRTNPVSGYLDKAVGNATQTASTVYQSDALAVSGWAADSYDNGPAKSVQVLIDGAVAGNATLGGSRPDVASAYNNPAWKLSGWSYSMSASSLSVGSHVVTVVAADSLGLTNTFNPVSITVAAATPVGFVDAAVDNANQSPSVYQSDSLAVVGWAADYNDNGPAKSVQVVLDGSVLGTATLGGSRPDVASAYNDPAWKPSGWSFSMSAASLALGNHTITAVATDSLGLHTVTKAASINVLPKITASLPSAISIKEGTPAVGTLTLSSAAPSGGLTFSLAIDSTATATTASSVTVQAGATTASFTLTGVQAGSTVLRATASDVGEADSTLTGSATTAQVIKHIVVIFDENVSFDHYFGTYPVATNPSGEPAFTAASGTPAPAGLSGALLTSNPNSQNSTNGSAAVNPFRLDRAQAFTADQDHGYYAEQVAFHNGAMDLFPYSVGVPDSASQLNQTGASAVMATNGVTMGYYDGNTVTALWNYAQHYTLSDHFFATNFGPSTPGALNLISGQTNGAVVDAGGNGAVISDGNSGFTLIGDPDPTGDICSNASNSVHMTGKNIGDLLTSAGVSWGWFAGGFDLTVTNANGSTGCNRASTSSVTGVTPGDYNPHHEAFQYYVSTSNLNHVRPSSVSKIGANADSANHQYDLHDFTDAIAAGNMPAVSFLKPPNYQDGHAGYSDPLDEQTFLVNTLNAIEQSSFWQSTAVIIAYDDSDGWYDHMINVVNASQSSADALASSGKCSSATATIGNTLPGVNPSTTHAQGRCGYGPRLPMLLISPWAKPNNIDSNVIDQTSITRLIEDTFLSGQRIGGGSFDSLAGAMDFMFDFTHPTPQNPSVVVLDPSTGLVTSSK